MITIANDGINNKSSGNSDSKNAKETTDTNTADGDSKTDEATDGQNTGGSGSANTGLTKNKANKGKGTENNDSTNTKQGRSGKKNKNELSEEDLLPMESSPMAKKVYDLLQARQGATIQTEEEVQRLVDLVESYKEFINNEELEKAIRQSDTSKTKTFNEVLIILAEVLEALKAKHETNGSDIDKANGTEKGEAKHEAKEQQIETKQGDALKEEKQETKVIEVRPNYNVGKIENVNTIDVKRYVYLKVDNITKLKKDMIIDAIITVTSKTYSYSIVRPVSISILDVLIKENKIIFKVNKDFTINETSSLYSKTVPTKGQFKKL